ncbi:3-methyl-2-oxobutanoate dehydrogenase subunit beta [bacterium]|nr:3-methyl-2-oxobutanoate dehydrogenase subunit beta [bacterium]
MNQEKKKLTITIPEEEIMQAGHLACQGCGAAIAMRYALKALGKDIILDFPACCWSVIDGPFPYSATQVPLFHTAFETAAAVASGITNGIQAIGNDHTTVMAWAGDGGTFDIGIQALSGAAERNDNLIYTVYDNEAYMNTGIQRSSATPHGAWTTTTPVKHFKKGEKKDIDSILVAHGIPYLATTSIAYAEDMVKKYKRAKEIRGTKFMHVFAPCPTGWKSDPAMTVKLAKLAVETGVFPLYEVVNGKYKLSIKPKELKPVEEYLKLQGRFKHLQKDDIDYIQKKVIEKWEILLKKVEMFGE